MPTSPTLAELVARIETLEGEAAVRRLQARYMFLCDTPCPEFGVADDAERIDLILDLYTDDAVWEGVGDYYNDQFGRLDGKQALREHFQRFWGERRDPALVLNAHYLTAEQIYVAGNQATGQWIHVQPWLYADGSGLLRSSRLNNAFRKVDGRWLISRTRTENVFVAPLQDGFADAYPTSSVLMKP
ncbi:nuclear transport factor 2 family protein [Gordonia sp. TBRC 11910]|uniref:Nuclear transport factor 2 family protein n=1 Tax=Gordonia asplenii TaxID=2725283 RepID=A0A848KXR6_9ACTN|nr:nuclear transport factor 2 family protein [Gordonia asplenii]NMO03032.1 nuclear transport factor 2 family protein [Gordonia asplenii]